MRLLIRRVSIGSILEMQLQTTQDRRFINRELVNLRDICIYDSGYVSCNLYDVSAHYARQSLSIFNEMRNIAQWMCDDPERRLYKKRFGSTVFFENAFENGGVPVLTDAQSQAGMYHFVRVVYPGMLADARKRWRRHFYTIHYGQPFYSIYGEMFVLLYATSFLVAALRRR